MSRSGPPETVLDPEPADALAALADALDRAAPPSVATPSAPWWPGGRRFLDGWAQLGDHARDDVEAYACYRVAYHRGLDRLRASGWRGSGYVRWRHETNRGFLRGLGGPGPGGRPHRRDRRGRSAAPSSPCQLDPGIDPTRPLPSLP